MAAYAGVALDEPAAGVAALYDDKSAEVRTAGITSLEHYIGRGAVEDVRLYKVLMARQIKSGQASIIMEMLHGLGSEARLRPETYETLITYLENEQLAIRELASRTLRTLVPQGQNITFDAASAPEARARGQASWRKLIPEGSVPKMP